MLTSLGLNLQGASVNIIISVTILLNLAWIVIGILISSLVAYFFGRIFNAEANKKTFIYIFTFSNIIIQLINIPLAIGNFLNDNFTKIILIDNPQIMFLNPLIYLAVLVFYKLLRIHTKMSKPVIIGYCFCFYLLKIAGVFLSNLQQTI